MGPEGAGECGASLQRMRENILQEKCQACTVPFEKDGEMFIVNCCQVVVCGFCVEAGGSYIQRCPNCSTAVTDPARSLIYIRAGLELELVFTDEPLPAEEAAAEEEEGEGGDSAGAVGDGEPEGLAAAMAASRPETNCPRLQALLQLIRGAPVQCVSDAAVPPIVEGLLEGCREAPHPADDPHRHLIFTMYAESTREIVEALKRDGIPHAILQGSRIVFVLLRNDFASVLMA